LGFEQLNELLRFRSRNESALVAQESVPGEFHGAEQVLERFALATASDQLAERRQFRFRKGALELEVKLDALALERVRQQVLGVQARTLDFALLEISGGRLQDLEDRHDGNSREPAARL
jgi:hypothetical protein